MEEGKDRLQTLCRLLAFSMPYRKSSNYEERFSESLSHRAHEYRSLDMLLSCGRLLRLFEVSGSLVLAVRFDRNGDRYRLTVHFT